MAVKKRKIVKSKANVAKKSPLKVPPQGEVLRYSVSLVTQGDFQFYSLTIPTEILGNCAFATSRAEDPKTGFQRVLDRRRAQDIADYIDAGGTIPNSIILSAQADAMTTVVGRGKTLEFKFVPKAFLILDGQHRVFGFSLAKTSTRVPVVIYAGLTKAQESRLFIDINTKQKPVPNELLLDIKQLAEYEVPNEVLLRRLFDKFSSDPASALIGKMSASTKAPSRISRVTFNGAAAPLLKLFPDSAFDSIYSVLNAYISAANSCLKEKKASDALTNPTTFRAILATFKFVAEKVHDKYGKAYSTDNFYEVLGPAVASINKSRLLNPGNSYRDLSQDIVKKLSVGFQI